MLVVRRDCGDLFFGGLADVLLLAERHGEMEAVRRGGSESGHRRCRLKVFWGYAAWGPTQLLAEMARRSWGLSEQWEQRGGLRGLDEGRMAWTDVVDHMSIAKASEYSRNEE